MNTTMYVLDPRDIYLWQYPSFYSKDQPYTILYTTTRCHAAEAMFVFFLLQISRALVNCLVKNLPNLCVFYLMKLCKPWCPFVIVFILYNQINYLCVVSRTTKGGEGK